MAAEGFNWFIILVVVVVTILVLIGCVYILIEYQHPEDRNQAWFPKAVVIFGLSLAILTVLMFPLDVANQEACSSGVSPSACTYTLPMETLWNAVFIANLVLVFAIIPFTVFFYEADSDFTFFQQIKAGLGWAFMFVVFISLVIGILYALVGYVVYPTQQLSSGTLPLVALSNLNGTFGSVSMANDVCIPLAVPNGTVQPPDQQLCNAFHFPITITQWKLRVSLPVYIIAVQSVLGWLLFLVFAGVGIMGTPIGWIFEFLGRPQSVISKSEYMRRARIIAQRAKAVTENIQLLRRQSKDRKWRSNLKRVEREVVLLEEDEWQLERVYPQGEDGEVRWVLFMMGFWVTGFMGILGIFLSLAWLIQIAVYMLPPYPIAPFLNTMFVALDAQFALLGVAAFAGFVLYMMVVSIQGSFMLGLDFVFIKLYPMRKGATLMSAFLVNTALILCMAPAILQFCATAFAVYGAKTAIFDIFGNQVMYLMGISWLYRFNIFLYIFYAICLLSIIYFCFKGKSQWVRKRDKFEAYTS